MANGAYHKSPQYFNCAFIAYMTSVFFRVVRHIGLSDLISPRSVQLFSAEHTRFFRYFLLFFTRPAALRVRKQNYLHVHTRACAQYRVCQKARNQKWPQKRDRLREESAKGRRHVRFYVVSFSFEIDIVPRRQCRGKIHLFFNFIRIINIQDEFFFKTTYFTEKNNRIRELSQFFVKYLLGRRIAVSFTDNVRRCIVCKKEFCIRAGILMT